MIEPKCIAAYNYQDGTASLHFDSGSELAIERHIDTTAMLGKSVLACLTALDEPHQQDVDASPQ